MRTRLASLFGVAVGGAAMYLFDRERGRRRRALIRDRAVSVATRVRDTVDAGKRDLAHRGRGVIGRARQLVRWRIPDERTLAERVRAKLGRLTQHPGAIEVEAHQGEVTLIGSVLGHEYNSLLEGVRSVRGVKSVVDSLAIYRTAEGISELQGGRARRPERVDFLQDNWAPGTRVVAGAAGTTLALYALRGGLPGIVLATAGALLLLRSATNKPLRRLAGYSGRRGFDVQKTITIHAPVEQVFEYLSDYANFPLFMRNVHRVEPRAEGQWHWVVAGPAGVEVQWNAVATQHVPNELIAWRTTPDSSVAHAGIMRFERFHDGTRVHITMSYNPPAGVLGHAVAKFFGADPQTELDEDLMRLKTILETGKPSRGAAATQSPAAVAVPA